MFNVILFVLVFVALILSIMNRSGVRRNDEDIDEIRASLFELRKHARSGQADNNKRFAEIRMQIMKAHDKLPENRVPYFITADCIACGTCVPECPVTAISEGDIFVIDPETCIACKKCAEVCPVNACQPLVKT